VSVGDCLVHISPHRLNMGSPRQSVSASLDPLGMLEADNALEMRGSSHATAFWLEGHILGQSSINDTSGKLDMLNSIVVQRPHKVPALRHNSLRDNACRVKAGQLPTFSGSRKKSKCVVEARRYSRVYIPSALRWFYVTPLRQRGITRSMKVTKKNTFM